MPCDSRPRRRGQTIQQRAAEVRAKTERLSKLLADKAVKVKVGPQGAVAFEGWAEAERDGITDACAYRRIMAAGTALAKAEIMRAEAMAGRTIDPQQVAAGIHSHDGGSTWHEGH